MMAEWLSGLPNESGYYLTVYHNHEQNADMLKAFWFDSKTKTWMFRFEPDVKAWWNVRHDYYVPCQQQKVTRYND